MDLDDREGGRARDGEIQGEVGPDYLVWRNDQARAQAVGPIVDLMISSRDSLTSSVRRMREFAFQHARVRLSSLPRYSTDLDSANMIDRRDE
jgi:hypothetical protein